MAEEQREEQRIDGFVDVSDKKFVGIGRMVFDSNAEWNIPHLHFMVDQTNEGYEATLLEFGLVSWAENADEAITSLAKQTHLHILSIMEKNGFGEFILAVDDHVMDDYWRQYRKIDFMLAEKGKDLSHEMDSKLFRAIKAIITEEMVNYIKKFAAQSAETLIKMFVTPLTLTYTDIRAAA